MSLHISRGIALFVGQLAMLTRLPTMACLFGTEFDTHKRSKTPKNTPKKHKEKQKNKKNKHQTQNTSKHKQATTQTHQKEANKQTQTQNDGLFQRIARPPAAKSPLRGSAEGEGSGRGEVCCGGSFFFVFFVFLFKVLFFGTFFVFKFVSSGF